MIPPIARPRTCGGYPKGDRPAHRSDRSSPHMRGLPAVNDEPTVIGELVPAHAGVTRAQPPSPLPGPSRPRTCGGYPSPSTCTPGQASSSPHMRGLPCQTFSQWSLHQLVPAHAGVTRGSPVAWSRLSTRPRTCGGYPDRGSSGAGRTASSPHMRGLPWATAHEARVEFLVPAHAGVTRTDMSNNRNRNPRPRTCGGYPESPGAPFRLQDSSPHMRGLPDVGGGAE